jgi:sortase A
VTLTEERRAAARHQLAGLCSELNELAVGLSQAPPAEPPPAAVPAAAGRRRASRLISALGVIMIVGGIWFAARPLLALLDRNRVDQTALAQWKRGGSRALVGSAPAAAPPTTSGLKTCGGSSSGDSYALLSFPSLVQYGYSGVAGDGGWELLLRRSMVHYRGSAAPGDVGNDIVGFHREPNYEHIDQLAVGDPVVIQDRGCRLWHYTIRHRWVLRPEKVTQLGPTPDAELTLVTCDPWFRDDHRIVWQATLNDSPVSPRYRAEVSAGGVR